MGIESTYKNESLNEIAVAEITTFLNRKKGEAFWTLEKREGLSNKEWAEASDTTPTSLSNIILKFENFPYKLIESKSCGRKKCYYLTELAHEYIYLIRESDKDDENKNSVYQQEEWLLRQKFKEALEGLKARHREEWEIVIEDILVRRIYSLEDISKEEDKKSVNDIIFALEMAIEKEYDRSVDFCMKLLSPSAILSKRIEEYLQCFYAFTPFYEKIQQETEEIAIYRIFEKMILEGKTNECEQEIQRLGLEKKQGYELEKAMQQIKKYCYEQKEEPVYKKLQEFMPGRKQMNIILAFWLCHYNGQSK